MIRFYRKLEFEGVEESSKHGLIAKLKKSASRWKKVTGIGTAPLNSSKIASFSQTFIYLLIYYLYQLILNDSKKPLRARKKPHFKHYSYG